MRSGWERPTSTSYKALCLPVPRRPPRCAVRAVPEVAGRPRRAGSAQHGVSVPTPEAAALNRGSDSCGEAQGELMVVAFTNRGQGVGGRAGRAARRHRSPTTTPVHKEVVGDTNHDRCSLCTGLDNAWTMDSTSHWCGRREPAAFHQQAE